MREPYIFNKVYENWKPCANCFRWFNRSGDDTCSEICWDQWMETWVWDKDQDAANYRKRNEMMDEKLPGQRELF